MREKKLAQMESAAKAKLYAGEQIEMCVDYVPYRGCLILLGVIAALILLLRFIGHYSPIIMVIGNIFVVFLAFEASQAWLYGTQSYILITNRRVLGFTKGEAVDLPYRSIADVTLQGTKIVLDVENRRLVHLQSLKYPIPVYHILKDKIHKS